MPSGEAQIRELVDQAVRGDRRAADQLMTRYQGRLRRMVAVRIDPRMVGRVDPSDVVQETLTEAARRLSDFLKDESLPFYAWLRKLAWGHLAQLHRRHVQAHRRSVYREEPRWAGLSDESALVLASRLTANGTSPSGHMVREELRARLRSALDELADNDREVLVMRDLEQLKVVEIAAILGISEAAVKMRRARAFERLRQLLSGYQTGESP